MLFDGFLDDGGRGTDFADLSQFVGSSLWLSISADASSFSVPG